MRQDHCRLPLGRPCTHNPATVTPSDETFAQRLDAILKERDLSVRGLARLLAGPGAEHKQIESRRRALTRYLQEGASPERASSDEIAAALGLPPGSLPAEAEDQATRRFLAQQVDEIRGLLDELSTLIGEKPPDQPSVLDRLSLLEKRVDDLPTQEDVQRGLEALRRTIPPASQGTTEVASGS